MRRSPLSPRSLWLFLGWLCAQTGADACAEPSPCDQDLACREQLDQALQAERGQRYEEALRAFRAAHQRKPSPRLAVNIGRTLHKLGRYAEALGWYRDVGRTASVDTTLRQELRTFVADAKLAMDAPRIPPIMLQPTIQVQPAAVHLTPLHNLNLRLDTIQSMGGGTSAPQPTQPTHLLKRPWLWAAVGVVLAAGAIGGAVAVWPRPWQPDASVPSYSLFAAIAGGTK